MDELESSGDVFDSAGHALLHKLFQDRAHNKAYDTLHTRFMDLCHCVNANHSKSRLPEMLETDGPTQGRAIEDEFLRAAAHANECDAKEQRLKWALNQVNKLKAQVSRLVEERRVETQRLRADATAEANKLHNKYSYDYYVLSNLHAAPFRGLEKSNRRIEALVQQLRDANTHIDNLKTAVATTNTSLVASEAQLQKVQSQLYQEQERLKQTETQLNDMTEEKRIETQQVTKMHWDYMVLSDLHRSDLDKVETRCTLQVQELTKKLEEKADALENETMCNICFERKRTVVLKPCFHLLLCRKCADGLIECPGCRESITGRQDVFCL